MYLAKVDNFYQIIESLHTTFKLKTNQSAVNF
jgi:hypothetical protein